MSRHWLPLSLALCFIISLLLRILPPLHQIFTPLGVKFALNDAYYHMRLVDNLAVNFPHFSYYDPYFVFPGTTVIGGAHFFDWLVASVSWIVGLGNPTQATINTIGAYMPPLLATLLVIPVYFIGRTLFNKWVGLVGAGLVAILPGEFLGRSILGATDHHVAEVLFSTTAVMFFIMAIKSVSSKWTRIFTILVGLFLGVYLLTWTGGLLFILIIEAFVIAQIVIDHLRKTPSERPTAVVATAILIASLMNLSSTLPKEVMLAMLIAVVAPVALLAMSSIMLKRHYHPAVFPSIVAGACIAFPLLVNWLYPSFTGYLGMFLPTGSTATTTLELQPILSPHGQFTLAVLWSNFNLTAVLAPVAIAVLVLALVKDKVKSETKLLLVIWSMVIIALMLNQRRYAYYTIVNMALLSGYLVYVITVKLAQVQKKQGKKLLTFVSPSRAWPIAIVIALVLVPLSLSTSIQTAKNATFAPSNAWQSAMLWMRDNTLEPFGDDLYDDYLPLLEKDLPEGEVGRAFVYKDGKRYLASPKPDYTVSAWWDYGYWVTRIGHRVPNANPSQNVEAVKRIAELFLSTGDDYSEIADSLKSEYVVLDNTIALGKFYAVASWGDRTESEYFGVYKVPNGEGYASVMLFYPAYYQTLVSRLYNSNGESVIPDRTVVITYRGNTVLDAKEFTDYYKAKDYVEHNPGTMIVGADPRISPVPLEEMDYELVYGSVEQVNGLAEVKIFRYTGEK